MRMVGKQNHQLKLKILKFFRELNVRTIQVLVRGVKGNNIIEKR